MITPGIVAFNPIAFIAQYPVFRAVPTFRGVATFPGGNAMNVTAVTSGTLNVGDAVSDAAGAVPAGALIATIAAGGGIGAYTLNAAANAAAGDSILVSAALTQNFSLACLLLNNSFASVVQDAPTRAQLLNLLVAHLTALLNGTTDASGNLVPPAGTVGRISSAHQGSVSVATSFKTMSEAASFFTQTQWGALWWQATAIYRTARYVRPCWGNGYGGFASEAWPE